MFFLSSSQFRLYITHALRWLSFLLLISMSTCPLAVGLMRVLSETTIVGHIVLLTLFLASIMSWSVTLYKLTSLQAAKRKNSRFSAIFYQDQSPLSIHERKIHFRDSPLFKVYKAGCEELCFQLFGAKIVDNSYCSYPCDKRETISPAQMHSIASAMERAIGESTLQLESLMIFLSTAITGAPFLGLLGTVWGIMDIFAGISVTGKTTLAAVAPGVSGALTTTISGLLVAIPAMFGYNFLIATIRSMILQCESFATELSAKIEHRYVTYSNLQ